MKNKEIIKVFSKKQNKFIEFKLKDNDLFLENYECVGCSNADYGS